MDNKKLMGYRLAQALDKRGMQQKELAKSLGVTDNTISYFCSGARTPNALQLLAIADTLNVSTDYLYGRTKDGDYSSDKKTAVASAATGLDTDTIKKLGEWSGNPLRRKLLNALLTADTFADALRYLEMACGLQSKLRDVSDETKGAVDYFNYLSATHERGSGNIELAPSDKVKFCRQETVDILSDIIKDIIDKEGVNNG